MMFFSSAFRNVKKQSQNYAVYFLCVTIIVSLLFSVMNAITNKDFVEIMEIREMQWTNIMLVALMAAVATVALSRAQMFMIEMRKKEFGIYLTVGMKRKDILRIFVGEIFIVFTATLVIGCVLGIVIYQWLMMFIMKLLDMEVKMSSYSLSGIGYTVLIVILVFLVSSASAYFYLKKTSIRELVSAKIKQKNSFSRGSLIIWSIVSLCCLAFYLYLIFYISKINDISGEKLQTSDPLNEMLAGIVMALLFIVSTILLHISVAKILVPILLKSKKMMRGTNTLVLRQLGRKLNANAVMLGMVALMIFFSTMMLSSIFSTSIVDDYSDVNLVKTEEMTDEEFRQRQEGLEMDKKNDAVIIIISCYIGMMFVIISVALMALKVTADADSDMKGYDLLYKLGLGESKIKKVLLKQLAIYFCFPLVFPVVSFIVMYVVEYYTIFRNSEFLGLGMETYFTDEFFDGIKDMVLIFLLIMAVFLICFIASYMTMKKNIIMYNRSRK